MGEDTVSQARAEAVAHAAAGVADSVRPHAEHAARAVQSAAGAGVRAARHGTEQVAGTIAQAAGRLKRAAGPAREVAVRTTRQPLPAARTLPLRTGRSAAAGGRTSVRVAVALAAAVTAGALVWRLARVPEDTLQVVPLQPVPPA